MDGKIESMRGLEFERRLRPLKIAWECNLLQETAKSQNSEIIEA